MTTTTNYKLNQWDASDQVTRAQLNGDNSKIEAALLLCGNCQLYYGSYTGFGYEAFSMSFNHKPLVVFIRPATGNATSETGIWAIAGSDRAYVRLTDNQVLPISIKWTETGFTFYGENTTLIHEKGKSYKIATLSIKS